MGLTPAHILKKMLNPPDFLYLNEVFGTKKNDTAQLPNGKSSTLLSQISLKVMPQLLPERKRNLVLIIVFYINRKRLMTSPIAKLHRTGEPNGTLPNVKKVMPHSTLLVRIFSRASMFNEIYESPAWPALDWECSLINKINARSLGKFLIKFMKW